MVNGNQGKLGICLFFSEFQIFGSKMKKEKMGVFSFREAGRTHPSSVKKSLHS